MFIVAENITAADFIVFAALAPWFSQLNDFQKLELPNAFRWIDHIQHLPGMLEQVQAKGVFTTFPDENAEGPSKSELKKLAKMQAAADKKAAKKAGTGAEEQKKDPKQ